MIPHVILPGRKNGWFIQVNSVSAAACVDFPYGVSVPLHCIFPTHTLYTAFHVEENHSHLFNFRGQICGTIQREGSATHACVGRGDVFEEVLARKQNVVLTPSPVVVGSGEKGVEASMGDWLQEGKNVLTTQNRNRKKSYSWLRSSNYMLLKMQTRKKKEKKKDFKIGCDRKYSPVGCPRPILRWEILLSCFCSHGHKRK